MVVLPDLINLTTQDLFTVLRAAGSQPVRATDDTGVPGHPVVFPRICFDALAQSDPSEDGPRRVLKAHGCKFVKIPNDHATRNLDTPEDWDAWRAANQT